MQLPLRHREESMYAKLNMCIYGLKQSTREWYGRLTHHLMPFRFTITSFDPYVLVNTKNNTYIAIYVDDLTLYGLPSKFMEDTVDSVKTEFEVIDLRTVHWLLGIQIEFLDSGIALSQSSCIDKILKRFGMFDCLLVTTPMEYQKVISKNTSESKPDDIKHYQQLIRSLIYAVMGTRPDLSYVITKLSQYMTNPSVVHLGAAK